MANKQLLIQAAERFVWKCEHGRGIGSSARSIETYNQLKKALAAPEAENDGPDFDVDPPEIDYVLQKEY